MAKIKNHKNQALNSNISNTTDLAMHD